MTTENHIDFTRVFDILSYQQKKYPQRKALNGKRNGQWKHYCINDVIQQADRISCWLIERGYQKGDRIAVMPKMGSPEWMMVDFACQQAGLILVPIHPTATLEEVIFILNETEATMWIVADAALYQRVLSLAASSRCKNIFHLESEVEGDLFLQVNKQD